MSSAVQLRVGLEMSHKDLNVQWLKFNDNAGNSVKMSQNTQKPQARFFSVCCTSPVSLKARKDWSGCTAHIKAIGPNQDEMKIVSVIGTHSCSRECKRKRNCLSRQIKNVSDILEVCKPAKSGNVKQCIQMTRRSTGLSLKFGQAASAVQKKAHDSVEAMIGQHLLVPSLIATHKEEDPDGTCVFECAPCRWNGHLKEFKRAHFAMSTAKTFWSCAGIELFCCDGTFTKLAGFEHIVLIAATMDGNSQIAALTFGIYDVENSTNWAWFKECLEQDFPGFVPYPFCHV